MPDNTPIKATHFEGRPVDAVQFKVVGSMPLEDLAGQVVSIDDRVQMLGIFTVSKVNFDTDPKTGNLIRVQTLKPVELHLMPFDENDPNDDGILRALLPGTTTSGTTVAPAGGDDDE